MAKDRPRTARQPKTGRRQPKTSSKQPQTRPRQAKSCPGRASDRPSTSPGQPKIAPRQPRTDQGRLKRGLRWHTMSSEMAQVGPTTPKIINMAPRWLKMAPRWPRRNPRELKECPLDDSRKALAWPQTRPEQAQPSKHARTQTDKMDISTPPSFRKTLLEPV
jgi:hypothetical protein